MILSTGLPRRRSPPEIAARWRYRLPIENQHITTVIFVSAFIFIFGRKPKNASGHIQMGPETNFVHFKHACWFLFIQSWSSYHQMNAGKKI